MRLLVLTVAAGAGLASSVLATSPARSITLPAPSAVGQIADPDPLIEHVHCRDYKHRHKRGHRFGYGCREPVARRNAVPQGVAPLPSIGTPVRPNLSNPQDRLGRGNPQDMTLPRAINPQDMR